MTLFPYTTLFRSMAFDYGDGTTGTCKFYVDGVLGATLNYTIASSAEMNFLLGVKAGAGNAETLLIDYVRVIAER